MASVLVRSLTRIASGSNMSGANELDACQMGPTGATTARNKAHPGGRQIALARAAASRHHHENSFSAPILLHRRSTGMTAPIAQNAPPVYWPRMTDEGPRVVRAYLALIGAEVPASREGASATAASRG